jgi:large subunit ribosomal protein L27
MAHKKAAGSAKNLRDSQPKYRGVKLFGGQKAVAGNIIIRQKGSKYECGQNTYLAADFTIHALMDGVVVFKKKNFRRFDGRTYLKTVVAVVPETMVAQPTKTVKKAVIKKEVAPVVTEQSVKTEKIEKKAVEKDAPKAKKPATKKLAAEKTSTSTAKKTESTVKKTPTKKAVKKEEKSE